MCDADGVDNFDSFSPTIVVVGIIVDTVLCETDTASSARLIVGVAEPG
jgi:hypothetical protein